MTAQQQRRRLADLLGETRGDGFEEFLQAFEALPEVIGEENRMTSRFIRSIATAIIETARLEDMAKGEADHVFDIIAAAYAACGYVLPCMAVTQIRAEGVREVISHMREAYFETIHAAILNDVEAQAREEIAGE